MNDEEMLALLGRAIGCSIPPKCGVFKFLNSLQELFSTLHVSVSLEVERFDRVCMLNVSSMLYPPPAAHRGDDDQQEELAEGEAGAFHRTTIVDELHSWLDLTMEGTSTR